MSGVLAALFSGAAKFSPLSISGALLWLDASDAATITQSGGSISQWADKSGRANNATAAGAARPTIQAAAQNGKDTVRFTASSSQRMQLSSAIDLTGGVFTVAAVLRLGGPTGSLVVDTLGYSGAAADWVLELNYGNWVLSSTIYEHNAGAFAGATFSGYNQVVAVSTGQGPPFSGHVSSTVNNAPTGLSNYPGGSTGYFDLVGYGANAYSNGEIAEILVYNSSLTSGQLSALYMYQKAKWGTP